MDEPGDADIREPPYPLQTPLTRCFTMTWLAWREASSLVGVYCTMKCAILAANTRQSILLS